MKNKSFLILLLSVFALGFFQACDDDDRIDRYYPISWMPVTDIDGDPLETTYLDGAELQFYVPFKVHNGNDVESIVLSTAIVNPTSGEVTQKTKVGEYGPAEYEYLSEQMHHQVMMTYTVSSDLLDKKVQLLADFTTLNGVSQERMLAEFQIVEFENVIGGIPYLYMYDNSYVNSGVGYTVEHSSGYTALVTLMNYYGFDPENGNFQGELGGSVSAHNVDWVASFFVPTYSYLATDVYEVHRTYHLESGYYGGPKYLHSTEFGTYDQIEEAINNGQPVIVHGDFRNIDFKHQIILVGSNETEFMVIDPAGKWNGTVKGEYTKTSTAGQYTKYLKTDVYSAIGADGSIWMHFPVDTDEEYIEIAE